MPRSPAKLTPRQQEIFDLIVAAVRERGYPPTRAEIAAELGFRSANAAEDHLQALARKGMITLVPGASRGIRVNETAARRGSERAAALSVLQGHLPLPGSEQLCLPLIGRVAAGLPILAQQHVEQTLIVDPALFSARPDYLLKVRGASMRDAGILDGDLLAVRQASSAHNGQIVVARIGDEVTVKRWRQTRDRIELLPENPDFAPMVFTAGQAGAVSIEGLAVGLVRGGI